MDLPKGTLSSGQRARYVAYAIGVTVCFLAILDGVITWLGSQQTIDIDNPNDAVWFLESDPWTDNGNGWYVSTPETRKLVSKSRFRVEKGDAWRSFILGASFIMGAPYPHVGSIPYWLKRELTARYPNQTIELINAAQSAQNSHRVVNIAHYALQHSPDAIIVATCNNEGALPPSEVTRRLHRSGTFRLFNKWLKDDSEKRPIYTPQDADVDKIRAVYEANLMEIVNVAAERNIPVMLCTLPVNLRYSGQESGLPAEGFKWEQEDGVARSECVERGFALLKNKQFAMAEREFRSCRHLEALRGLGLAQFEQKSYEAARTNLEQYTELQPRNRCRPSFNAIIRKVAKNSPHVHLVDLEALAIKLSPGGIPGDELFVDYCHLNWEAQGKVADEILSQLKAVNAVPAGAEVNPELPPRRRIFERMKDVPPPPFSG